MTADVIELLKDEIQVSFIRASGPGGQNVNKVSTAVQLRLDVRNSPSLLSEVKERLTRIAGKRMTEDGLLVIEARRFRTQETNRQDALRRLDALLERAEKPPNQRKATRPSLSSKKVRLETKRKHGEIKRTRHRVTSEFD